MPPRPAARPRGDIVEIDPTSPYQRIAVQLRGQILDGVVAAGMPLQPVKQIAAEHGVSLSTALRAVKLLEDWEFVDVNVGHPTLVRVVFEAKPIEPAVVLDTNLPVDADRSTAEPLDLEVRRLGKVVSQVRAEADPGDMSTLQRLLLDAVRRDGQPGSSAGDYEMVVRCVGERGVVVTIVA